jgi:hypothetical protein
LQILVIAKNSLLVEKIENDELQVFKHKIYDDELHLMTLELKTNNKFGYMDILPNHSFLKIVRNILNRDFSNNAIKTIKIFDFDNFLI